MVSPLIAQQYGAQKVSKANLLYNYRAKVIDEDLKKKKITSKFQKKKTLAREQLRDISNISPLGQQAVSDFQLKKHLAQAQVKNIYSSKFEPFAVSDEGQLTTNKKIAKKIW